MSGKNGTLPWDEWIIDRYIGKSESSAYFEVHHEKTNEKASIERKDVYLPEEFEMQLKRSGASVQNYSDYYLSEAVNRIQIAEKLGAIKGIIGAEEYKYTPNIKAGYTMYIRRKYALSLSEYLLENTLTLEEYVKGIVDICDALEACHKQSVVYGGVRHESIYITKDKHFLLGTDYIFALRNFGEKIDRFYMNGLTDSAAPETVNGGECSEVSDVYTVGILLYTIFNEGKIPFFPLKKSKRHDHIYQGAVERRLSGEELLDPVDGTDEMKAVIRKACEFKPADRYASIAELKAALKDLLKRSLVVPPVDEEDDDDVDDEHATDDYKAEMAARAKAEEYKKQSYLNTINQINSGEKDPIMENNNPFRRTKFDKPMIVRVLAAVCLVVMIIIQIGNSGFFRNTGAQQETEQETQVQTEAETQTETETNE